MPPDRRLAFQAALPANLHEWDAVMGDTTPLAGWTAALPARTLLCADPQTNRPIREIVGLMRASALSTWTFAELPGGGHMAPLSRPDLVNPIIERFLRS